MKRFLYDALLLSILIIIGLSISDYEKVDQQDKLNQFQKEIENDKVVKDVKKKSSLNQVDENNASIFAKGASDVVKGCINFSIETITGIFEIIVK